MYRPLFILLCLLTASTAVLRVSADPVTAAAIMVRAEYADEFLAREIALFDPKQPLVRAAELVRARDQAEAVHLEAVKEATPLSASDPDKVNLTAAATKLAGHVSRAKALLDVPTLLSAVTGASSDLTLLIASLDKALAAVSAATAPDEFTGKYEEIIRFTAELEQANARYKPLAALAYRYGLDPATTAHKDAVETLNSKLEDARVKSQLARQKTIGDRSRYVTKVVRLYFFQNSEHMLQNLVSPGRKVYQVNAERIAILQRELSQARQTATLAQAEFTRVQAQRIADNDALLRAKAALEDAERKLAEAKQTEAEAKKKEEEASELAAKRLDELGQANKAVDAADADVTSLGMQLMSAMTDAGARDAQDKQQITSLDEQIKALDSRIKDEKDPAVRRQLVLERGEHLSERRKFVRDIDERQQNIRNLEKQKREAELRKKNAQTEAATADQRRKDATAAHERAKTATTTATGVVTTAGGAVTDANQVVTTKNESLDKALTNAVVASRTANQKAAELADAKADLKGSPSPWVAEENLASTDPIDRVRIQADTGSVMLLRGRPEDVDKALRVIKDRDRPGAQVRAVFWTIQVNGADTPKHTKSLERAIQDINRELAIVRGQVAVTGSTLREAIVAQYHSTGGGEYRLFTDRMQKLLENRNELSALGFPIHTRLNLHPLNLSTYGETVAVFALLDRKHQLKVLKEFNKALPARLAEMEVTYLRQADRIGPKDMDGKREELKRYYTDSCKFIRVSNHFNSALPIIRVTPPGGVAPVNATTPPQREIDMFLEAMQKNAWLKLDHELTLAEPVNLPLRAAWERYTEDEQRLIFRLLDRPGDQRQYLDEAPSPVELARLTRSLREAGDRLDLAGLGVVRDEALRLRTRREYRAQMGDGGALDRRARVAAMDALIRRVMQATEDDIDLQFVQPALKRIRKAAAARGVTLGSIERNGVVAMNRTPARVDPHATLEIQLPPKVDFLKEVKNAASLAVAVQSGAFMGLLDQLDKTRPSALDDMPGTYFVESGNELEFTPVVGPDGQAIRMGVRLRRYSPVRLPNREKGQNFGKIERHNVDTDVQDTNFELLEIARFENQTTIGENRQRRGGIPILNQIPGLREIPFIGYFTRERERVVGNQESLIFMQTAIYPSVEDLIGLFAESEVTNSN